MAQKRNKSGLSDVPTDVLMAEIARRQALEPEDDMTAMELAFEQDGATLREKAMATRLQAKSEAEDSKSKRCPKCGGLARVKAKKRARTLQTLCGQHTYRRNYHYCEACGSGWYPLDEELGISKEGDLTFEVEKRILDLGVTDVFENAANRWSVHYSFPISENLVRRVVDRAGKALEGAAPLAIQQELLPSSTDAAASVLIVALDGSMLPIRGEEPWKEAKVGVVARAEPAKAGDTRLRLHSRRYTAVVGGPSDLKNDLAAALQADRALESPHSIWLGDGAPWIWNLAERLHPKRTRFWIGAMRLNMGQTAGKCFFPTTRCTSIGGQHESRTFYGWAKSTFFWMNSKPVPCWLRPCPKELLF